MNKKGFSLVELMVTMLIVAIIMAMTGVALKAVLSPLTSQGVAADIIMEKLYSQEMIRLDLEHVGFGIAIDESDSHRPIIYDDTVPRSLELRSTLNNSKPETIGWSLIDCTVNAGNSITSGLEIGWSGVKPPKTSLADGDTGHHYKYILLDRNKNFKSKTTGVGDYNCPPAPLDYGVFTAFPYNSDTGATNSCDTTHFCSKITYELSTTANPLSTCNPSTFNLLRKVDGGSGEPILNCVADFFVRFDRDNDYDGDIDQNYVASPGTTTSSVIQGVKSINMYVLMQAGRKDRDVNFTGSTVIQDVDLDGNIVTVGTLNLPGHADDSKYNWKIVKISGVPMSWQ